MTNYGRIWPTSEISRVGSGFLKLHFDEHRFPTISDVQVIPHRALRIRRRKPVAEVPELYGARRLEIFHLLPDYKVRYCHRDGRKQKQVIRNLARGGATGKACTGKGSGDRGSTEGRSGAAKTEAGP